MEPLGLALPCGEVLTLALGPFWALASVWGSELPNRERFRAWLGVSAAFFMIWTVPLLAVMSGVGGGGMPEWLIPVVCIASIALGLRASAVHRRRVAGEEVGAPWLAWACLAFGAAVALMMAPAAAAGGLRHYLGVAGVIALVTSTQAWLLLPPNVVTRAGACAALAGIVGAAPLLSLLR